MLDTTQRFPLRWARTWPDKALDFSATDRGVRVGRVHRVMSGPADRKWHWNMFAFVGNHTGNASGVASDRGEACELVEERYRKFRERIDS